ncbi:MAG: glycosyltransferase family 39 protein [Rubripirellula sp.]
MKRILLVLLLALTAAKIGAVLVRGPVSIELDASQYWRLSTVVMSGDVLLLSEPIAYRTPIYPWFLAIIRLIFGSYALMATVVIQGFLSFATIVIAGKIAARVTKLPSAFSLTLLAALPAVSALTFSAAVLTETLFVFLLMLNVLAVLDAVKHETTGRSVWAGITFAVTLLTRPIVLLLWPAHILFVLFVHWRRRARIGKDSPHRVKLGKRLMHLGAAALAIAIVISPWLMRNQSLFGKPFLTEFVGRNIWIVTFQDGSGTGLELPESDAANRLRNRLSNVGVENWRNTWSVSKGLVASGLNDPQADQLMKRVSLDALEANRNPFAYKAFRRVVNFWRCAATDLPVQGGADDVLYGQHSWLRMAPPVDWALRYRWSQSVLLNTVLLGVLAIAVVVLVFRRSTRPYGVWFAMILAYFAFITGILEIPAYRYRMVLEPLIALTIGAAVAVLLSRRQKPAVLVEE